MCAAGIPTQGYQLVYEPIFAALESDPTILQTLGRLQNQTGLLTNLVNGVDTVVDSKAPATCMPYGVVSDCVACLRAVYVLSVY
jgi:hypothetical protein